MKKAQQAMCKFVAGFAMIVITLWGCNEDIDKTGYDLLLPGDLVSARKVSFDKDAITSYTVSDEKLRTNKPTLSLLGTFNDPVFGKTTTDFAYQFRLEDYQDLTNVNFDTLTLTLFYYTTYGDTVTPQNLKVYELNTAMNPDAVYYQDIDLPGMANDQALAELNYVPKFRLDSLKKDTLFNKIKFYLDPSLGQKLMAFKIPAVRPEGYNPNDDFINYFKGLYIEAGDLDQGGSIMKIVPGVEDAKKVVYNSEMKLYFHKAGETKIESMIYRISSTSARTSRFVHDYSTTAFAANLDKLDQQDSLIYLQTTGGLNNKIYIPQLNDWKDSADCAINKAELIFKVDESYTDTLLMPPPEKIILSLMDSVGGIYAKGAKRKLIFPSDLTFSEQYYGGTYNKDDSTYRFNLAKHLQEIIKKVKYKDKNYGFYLTTDDKNAIFRRVVLKGATSNDGIRFEVIYSKIK